MSLMYCSRPCIFQPFAYNFEYIFLKLVQTHLSRRYKIELRQQWKVAILQHSSGPAYSLLTRRIG
jgi:hypothetical protein